MASFEYRYRFSVDEEIIARYDDSNAKYMMETRTSFLVKGRCGGERLIDSERYAVDLAKDDYDDYIHFFMGLRLIDYGMPDDQVRRLINEFVDFAKQIAAGGRPGMIPAAVDLEVCTVQKEDEEIGATVERAMRLEVLPRLYLYPMANLKWGPYDGKHHMGKFSMEDLVGNLKNYRVEDVDKASMVMEVCGVCGRKPIEGSQISTILCGHAFHYHCIVGWLLEESNSCPTCDHCPAFDVDNSTVLKDLEPNIFWHAFSHLISESDDSSDSDASDYSIDDASDYSDDDDSQFLED